jgi:hypothetical protein
MAQQKGREQIANRQDDTFKRHGPEPPENDSGPSPSIEEQQRATNPGSDASDSSAFPDSRGRQQR